MGEKRAVETRAVRLRPAACFTAPRAGSLRSRHDSARRLADPRDPAVRADDRGRGGVSQVEVTAGRRPGWRHPSAGAFRSPGALPSTSATAAMPASTGRTGRRSPGPARVWQPLASRGRRFRPLHRHSAASGTWPEGKLRRDHDRHGEWRDENSQRTLLHALQHDVADACSLRWKRGWPSPDFMGPAAGRVEPVGCLGGGRRLRPRRRRRAASRGAGRSERRFAILPGREREDGRRDVGAGDPRR